MEEHQGAGEIVGPGEPPGMIGIDQDRAGRRLEHEVRGFEIPGRGDDRKLRFRQSPTSRLMRGRARTEELPKRGVQSGRLPARHGQSAFHLLPDPRFRPQRQAGFDEHVQAQLGATGVDPAQ